VVWHRPALRGHLECCALQCCLWLLCWAHLQGTHSSRQAGRVQIMLKGNPVVTDQLTS
jgi:hypothetical protein